MFDSALQRFVTALGPRPPFDRGQFGAEHRLGSASALGAPFVESEGTTKQGKQAPRQDVRRQCSARTAPYTTSP